ncbi:MAG TPA: MarR family transcriptional regulator [Acidimicrobiales bacterium]|nr:MarR family transcriptional regulator [Acidimicrobiales bacterium]
MQPEIQPIGLDVTSTGRVLSRAFNDALVAAGGSLPQWLVVMALKRGEHAMQRDIAAAIGIEGATLTHHLNRMEADGLVRRERVAGDRRSQLVALTPAGEALFRTLLAAVIAFDGQLRAGVSDRELATMRRLLARLRINASGRDAATDAR